MASWALGDLCADCDYNAPLPGQLLCEGCRALHQLEHELTAEVAARLTEAHQAQVISLDERTAAQ